MIWLYAKLAGWHNPFAAAEVREFYGSDVVSFTGTGKKIRAGQAQLTQLLSCETSFPP